MYKMSLYRYNHLLIHASFVIQLSITHMFNVITITTMTCIFIYTLRKTTATAFHFFNKDLSWVLIENRCPASFLWIILRTALCTLAQYLYRKETPLHLLNHSVLHSDN